MSIFSNCLPGLSRCSRLVTVIVTLSLLPVAVYAAIGNGASAIDMLGQYNDSLTDPQPVFTKSDANNGTNILGMNLGGGSGTIILDATNHRLFIADTMNNRVLVYSLNNDDTLPDRIPDFVLGQSVFYTNDAATTSSGLRRPSSMTLDSDAELLFVADTFNNRILVFDISSITSGEAAVNVIGQSSFTASGAATTASGLNSVSSLFYDGTNDRLFASDAGNNRVLVFTGSSLSNGMDANVVLGQANFTSATAATTQAGLSRPSGIAASGSTILVVDSGNNRILTYTGSSLATGMNANKVIGQTSFTVATAGTTQSKLSRPAGIVYAAPYLYVTAAASNRVVVFTGSSIQTGMNANKILGQTAFTATTAATTQAGMNGPATLGYDAVNNLLFVGQNRNNRVSIFDVGSMTNGENAVDLLGQYDDDLDDPQPVFTKSTGNNAPNMFGFSLNTTTPSPLTIDEVHHRLFITDPNNIRVLVYNLNDDNTLEDHLPDYVLGQPNFYTNTVATTQAGMNRSTGLVYDPKNNRLFVSQNGRIVVYDVTSITNGMSGSYVLGQSDFTNTGVATTQSRLNDPRSLAYDSERDWLFVADSANNRVLVFVFTGGTITNGMSGSYVLGQSDFTTSTSGTTQSTFDVPHGLAYDQEGQRLFVGESSNNRRVLVFDVSSITNGEDAVNVLGQPDFTSADAALTQSGLGSVVRSVVFDSNHNRLFVGDLKNRVLVYDTSSITNGEDAVFVLGQNDFLSDPERTDISATRQPQGLAYDLSNDRLYVAERSNNRITIFDVAPEVLASSSSSSSSSVSSSTNDNGGGGGRRGSPGRGGVAPRIDGHTIVSPAVSSSSTDGTTSNTSTGNNSSSLFSDVPSTAWFSTAVEEVVERKIFSGYADAQGNPLGDFGPADPVTVGQMLKVALLAGGYNVPVPAGIPINKMATDWSAPYVALAESLGLTLSSSDVHRNATRGEVIQTLLEAFEIGFDKDLQNDFTDLDASHQHAAAILTAKKLGIVTGDTNASGTPLHTVRPNDQINRAEVAVLVVRMLEIK